MHRAFHAIPPLKNPMGEMVNAVHGAVSMLVNVIQTIKPTHIAFAFDRKEPTFRNKLLVTYQSQRPPMADDLSSQFEKINMFLDMAKIPVYSKAGFEADDVIGTIATKFDNVTIVTGDRDILQLVDDQRDIKLFMPIAGLSNGKLFGENETIERMGVPPNQIPDLKALIGDPSDNYFGVSGIGPVTAIKLLQEYKSIENIYAHLDEIAPKIREKLEKSKDMCFLSLQLSTIDRQVPVDFNYAVMDKWKLDSKDVIDLFTNKFGFKTLTARIQKLGKDLDLEKQISLF